MINDLVRGSIVLAATVQPTSSKYSEYKPSPNSLLRTDNLFVRSKFKPGLKDIAVNPVTQNQRIMRDKFKESFRYLEQHNTVIFDPLYF
jgi:hypothetical protein